MAVRVTKIDAAAAVPIIELTVVEAPRCAAVHQLRLANAAQNGIELGIAGAARSSNSGKFPVLFPVSSDLDFGDGFRWAASATIQSLRTG